MQVDFHKKRTSGHRTRRYCISLREPYASEIKKLAEKYGRKETSVCSAIIQSYLDEERK